MREKMRKTNHAPESRVQKMLGVEKHEWSVNQSVMHQSNKIKDDLYHHDIKVTLRVNWVYLASSLSWKSWNHFTADK